MQRRHQAGETSASPVDAEDEDTWDKDKLLDTLHWLKQIVGAICGVLFGVLPITGLTGAIAYFAVVLLCTYVVYSSYLGLDEDDYGGHNVLLGEGLMPSFFV